MKKVIDFTNGTWGHALHGHTFSRIENHGSWLTRLIDRCRNITRASAMVHSSVYPRKGDKIKYKVANGIREAEIYDIDWCRDPRDMYTLYFMLRPQQETPGGGDDGKII